MKLVDRGWKVHLLALHFMAHVFLKEGFSLGIIMPVLAEGLEEFYGSQSPQSDYLASGIMYSFYIPAALGSLISPYFMQGYDERQKVGLARKANLTYAVCSAAFASCWIPEVTNLIGVVSASILMVVARATCALCTVLSFVQLNSHLSNCLLTSSPTSYYFLLSQYSSALALGYASGAVAGPALTSAMGGRLDIALFCNVALSLTPCVLVEFMPSIDVCCITSESESDEVHHGSNLCAPCRSFSFRKRMYLVALILILCFAMLGTYDYSFSRLLQIHFHVSDILVGVLLAAGTMLYAIVSFCVEHMGLHDFCTVEDGSRGTRKLTVVVVTHCLALLPSILAPEMQSSVSFAVAALLAFFIISAVGAGMLDVWMTFCSNANLGKGDADVAEIAAAMFSFMVNIGIAAGQAFAGATFEVLGISGQAATYCLLLMILHVCFCMIRFARDEQHGLLMSTSVSYGT
ncbi:MAG: hypothetical protein ISQ15_09905 [Ilumatobacteraceae bacterium]|nr:hypothetical protein [Ilumatobacteraceae bacterium]